MESEGENTDSEEISEEKESVVETVASQVDDEGKTDSENDNIEDYSPEESSELLSIDEEETDLDEAGQKLQFNRENVIKQFKNALKERGQLKRKNKVLQAKISTFFTLIQLDMGEDNRPYSEQESDYKSNLKSMENMTKEIQNTKILFEKDMAKLNKNLNEKEDAIKEMSNEFNDIKKSIASRAVNSETGQRMSEELVNFYLAREQFEDKYKREYRVKCIRSRNAVAKVEKARRELEDTTACNVKLNAFDRMIRRTLLDNVVVDKRCNIVKKLADRCEQTIHMLAHVKHKLKFIEAKKLEMSEKYATLEKEVDIMTADLLAMRIKHERTVKLEGEVLRQKFVMLRNEALLLDYEAGKKKYADLTEELEHLQKRYNDALSYIKKDKS